MKLGEELLKIVAKKYEPSTMVEVKFKGYDVSIKTDGDGNAILVFIGKKNEQGIIKGERYARTLKTDREGKRIKDHWELKGKAS
jgi:hypothetical protein